MNDPRHVAVFMHLHARNDAFGSKAFLVMTLYEFDGFLCRHVRAPIMGP